MSHFIVSEFLLYFGKRQHSLLKTLFSVYLKVAETVPIAQMPCC